MSRRLTTGSGDRCQDRPGGDVPCRSASRRLRQQDATAASVAHYALAVLHDARGDYGPALTAAARAHQADELTYSNVVLPEIVEAASRAGDPARGQAAVEG